MLRVKKLYILREKCAAWIISLGFTLLKPEDQGHMIGALLDKYNSELVDKLGETIGVTFVDYGNGPFKGQ